MLYATPDLGLDDVHVIDEIQRVRTQLTQVLRAPRRWDGALRRTSTAKAIQGSNTIEGYSVTDQDAVAAVDDEPPLTADEATWAEIAGYRRVLTYVLNVATEPGFVIDESVLRSMHFMLLEHDLTKMPGRYRTSAIYVRDDQRDATVYEGPDPGVVPELMAEFVRSLALSDTEEPLVRAAMAHLNLVMIHPFKDGNGRMARALQTMTLARDSVIEPVFSSIEEWLGSNTREYYEVLAATGQGAWNPERDASHWVQFNLRAHYFQAQTVARRFAEADIQLARIDEIVRDHSLPERLSSALFDATLGLRVTRPSYVKLTAVEERTATRDLALATDQGLLEARGERRGRHYVAGKELRRLRDDLRSQRAPLEDPYPDLITQIRRSLP
ncbi:Fic family protein [Branchiibius hedensis]|uniref:Fic family protein n=1 Tax=Branchiibius hedensis TaxID=672460 RepID=A0A2Y8ZW69_9MICO|nr:Fic family protein [Branchiibius hedensis]PWJ27514.1 Fic family protein [Branchiibius hedensis]SSA36324.1 Fic family protein [Branchiibius hedensis]